MDKKLLEQFKKELKKSIGKNVVKTGADDLISDPTFYLSTGCPLLDAAIEPQARGIPGGRIIEVYGVSSSGKSTFLNGLFASAQAMGGVCAMIDNEASWDRKYAAALGVNTDEMYMIETETLEDGFDAVDKMVERSEMFKGGSSVTPFIVAWDTIASAPTREELKKDNKWGGGIAERSRVISKGLRRLHFALPKYNVILVCINQVYAKIGQTFGDPTDSPGGYAFKHYSTIRLKLRSFGRLVEDEKHVGVTCGVRIIKNKMRPHGADLAIPLYFYKGFDDTLYLSSVLIKAGVIESEGSWHYLPFQFPEAVKKPKKDKIVAALEGVGVKYVEGDSKRLGGKPYFYYQGEDKFRHFKAQKEVIGELYKFAIEQCRHFI